MFRNLTQWQKLYAWIAALVVAALALSLYGTKLGEKKQIYRHLKNKTQELPHADSLIKAHQEHLAAIDRDILRLNPASVAIKTHNHFIQYIEEQCLHNQLKLISLPTEDKRQMAAHAVASSDCSIEGSFHGLIKMIHQVEHIDRVASIHRLHMHREKVRYGSSYKHLLLAEINFQRLLPN